MNLPITKSLCILRVRDHYLSMSKRKKKNSTNPARSHSNTFRKRIIPTPRSQELGTRTIIFEGVSLDYPDFFASIGRLSRDKRMSDEVFRASVTGALSTSINVDLLFELQVDANIILNILKLYILINVKIQKMINH